MNINKISTCQIEVFRHTLEIKKISLYFRDFKIIILGIKIMGTIGLLIASYQNGNISADEIKKCIEMLRDSGRHIGEKYFQLLYRTDQRLDNKDLWRDTS